MGDILGELKDALGDDYFDRERQPYTKHRWFEICVCGHLDKYHSPSIGGGYVLKESHPMRQGPRTDPDGWTARYLFHGCVGAVAARGLEATTLAIDHEARTSTETLLPTCPCEEFRPIAKVDRPNRYFNQRIPLSDRLSLATHPFTVGVRAFTTHLSRRRAALSDPAWATAEFARRFVWLDGKRVCGISKCTETDGVFPVFVHEDRSELRCPKHR